MAAVNGGVTEYSTYLEVANSAAQSAGAVIKEAFYKPKNIENKGCATDLVTETDKECERLVFSAIQSAFPEHALIGEEDSAAQGFTSELTDAPTWMVDPVDGTTNFVHGYPFVCVSIGLAINQQVVVGVVFNPIMGELYSAVRGRGAFLNGQPIRVSDKASLSEALLSTEVGYSRDKELLSTLFGRMQAVTSKCRSVRLGGSCALDLCSVASGRSDLMYEIGFGGPWDVAGASLILEEAGGLMLDPAGGKFNLMSRRVMGACSESVAQEAAGIIAAIPPCLKEPQPQPLPETD